MKTLYLFIILLTPIPSSGLSPFRDKNKACGIINAQEIQKIVQLNTKVKPDQTVHLKVLYVVILGGKNLSLLLSRRF